MLLHPDPARGLSLAAKPGQNKGLDQHQLHRTARACNLCRNQVIGLDIGSQLRRAASLIDNFRQVAVDQTIEEFVYTLEY